MTMEFISNDNPSEAQCAELTAQCPTNPFYTQGYVEAQRSLGFAPWALIVREKDCIKTGCTAFMKTGRLSRSLEITSFPMLDDHDFFWERLIRFCMSRGVTHLKVETFASSVAIIPSENGEASRRKRSEFLLELQKPDLRGKISKNHARNIKRGLKAGLHVLRAKDRRACQAHSELIAASMTRRGNRGEKVSEMVPEGTFRAYTRSGAGELFQAFLGETVLSSVLVLLAEKGAYYHSAGNTPEGMALGASHFLIQEIANVLRDQSFQVFNLGGSDHSNPGLSRFKAGFGARVVDLEEADFFLCSRIRLKAIKTFHRLYHRFRYLKKI